LRGIAQGIAAAMPASLGQKKTFNKGFSGFGPNFGNPVHERFWKA
jgi:hypothetical protein